MSISPTLAGDLDHEIAEGQLRYVANQRIVVTAGAYDSEYHLCQIVFSKRDGSIMLTTPYMESGGGVLCEVSIDPSHDQASPLSYSFAKGGKATRHPVKFAHHPDGRVHFSQDGKVLTRIGRQSFLLTGSTIGRVFDLHLYRLSGFRPYKHLQRDLKRGHIRTRFTDVLPRAVVVSAEWRTKKSLAASIEPQGEFAGPKVNVQHRKTGQRLTAFWVGQPPGFKRRDHLLMITVAPTKPLEEITQPTMILQGGFDPHHIAEGDPPVKQTGFLSAIYPAQDIAEVEERLGSIDWNPPEVA